MSDYRVRKFQYDEPDGFSRMVWVRWARTAEEANRIVQNDIGTDPAWEVRVDEVRGPFWVHKEDLAEFDLRVFGPVLG